MSHFNTPQMRDIEMLYPKILQYAPGCPEPTAVDHLRDAADKLCRRARCWRDVEQFEIDGKNPEIIIGIHPYATLFEIEAVWFDEMQLTPCHFDDRFIHERHGRPRYFSQGAANSIVIFPPEPGELKISMFLKPSDNAEELPQFFFDQFQDALVNGALSTVLMLPNQPFSSPSLATYYASAFDNDLNSLSSYNQRGQQRARLRTKPSYF